MRTSDEISGAIVDIKKTWPQASTQKVDLLILELLLDIRELIKNNRKEV